MKKSLVLIALSLAAAGCGQPAAEKQPAATAPTAPAPAPAPKVGTDPGNLAPAVKIALESKVGGVVTKTEFDSSKATGVVAYVVNSKNCPYSKKYAERMAQVEKTYAAKGVTFVYLYPNRTETADEIFAFHTEKGMTGPLSTDRGGVVTQSIAGKKTPEYVIVDAKGVIAYRGGVDDSGGDWKSAKKQYLTDALDAALSGTAPAVKKTDAPG